MQLEQALRRVQTQALAWCFRCTSAQGLSVCLLACVLALGGCTQPDDGPSRLDNYLERLARALGTEMPEPTFIAPPRYLDANIDTIDTQDSRIGVLDFLALSGCELQVNLGRRNSSLGRNASPSQRLLLDLEFLRLAPACTRHLDSQGEGELAKTIADIAQERRRDLPKRIYNALLAGPEMATFWRIPAALGSYPADTGGDVIDALNWWQSASARWLSGDFNADSQTLEWRLSQLRAGDGGALLLASAQQARALDQGSRALLEQADSLCPGGRHTDAAKITETVAAKFFAGDVQSWLADLNRRRHVLSSAIGAIEQQLMNVLPTSYRQWQAARNEALQQLELQPKRHVEAIKIALQDCPSVRWQ